VAVFFEKLGEKQRELVVFTKVGRNTVEVGSIPERGWNYSEESWEYSAADW
jgi:hypothetical protein